MICLMMSLRTALLRLSLVSLSVILGAFGTEWSVKYNQQEICALKGSTVFMNGTFTHPEGLTVTETFSIIDPVPGVEPTDLSKGPDYSGRVECLTDEQKRFSLKLSDVMKKDEHQFYFRIITNVEIERWVGTPGVQLRVTELRVEAPEEVTEGETADLTCKTTCSLTDPTFIWYKNGRPLTTKTIKNNQLHLQTVSSEDAGRYSCAVGGSQHLRSTAHSLRVRYPPKNVSVSISPSGEIVEGSTVTLTCSSDGNPPVKMYTWFKGSTSVGEGKTYSIPNIRSEDSGEYTCQSRNDHGQRRSTAVNLTVFYSPKNVSVSISSSRHTLVGFSVTLTCSSDGNPPVKIYTWFKEGGTSPVGSGHSYSPLQSGSYYCEARNQHGAQNATAVSVEVKGFPYAVIYAVAGVGCGVIVLGVISIFLIRNKRRVKKSEDLLVDTVYSEIWARSATTDAALNRSASQEDVYANVSASRPEENGKAESSPVKTSVCMAAVEVEVKEESQEDEVQYASVRFHHCSPPISLHRLWPAEGDGSKAPSLHRLWPAEGGGGEEPWTNQADLFTYMKVNQ
ncbi:sialoadhesin-like [Pygocentrus nattereri]|uniref:sialoadhesin-like n=1 Tax=Pygocentrus nattereri TaxID=42514 RepID=UPI0018914556|nr:sialoadhesin-like [Pygocentrus nattereri]